MEPPFQTHSYIIPNVLASLQHHTISKKVFFSYHHFFVFTALSSVLPPSCQPLIQQLQDICSVTVAVVNLEYDGNILPAMVRITGEQTQHPIFEFWGYLTYEDLQFVFFILKRTNFEASFGFWRPTETSWCQCKEFHEYVAIAQKSHESCFQSHWLHFINYYRNYYILFKQ